MFPVDVCPFPLIYQSASSLRFLPERRASALEVDDNRKIFGHVNLFPDNSNRSALDIVHHVACYTITYAIIDLGLFTCSRGNGREDS